jgi:hypothetical protein
MTFDQITHTHFYLETKGKIEPKFEVHINPNTQLFYKSDNVYYAITFIDSKTIYLNLVIGKNKDTASGLRNFIKWAKMAGVEHIIFGTCEDSPTLSLYKYMRAQFLRKINNFFIDGGNYVEYVLHLNETNRFK